MTKEEIFEFVQFSIGENKGVAPNEMLLSTGLIVKKFDVVKEFAALKLVKIDGYRDCVRWWTEFLKKAQYYLKIEIEKTILEENASISEGENDSISVGSDNNEIEKKNSRKSKDKLQD